MGFVLLALLMIGFFSKRDRESGFAVKSKKGEGSVKKTTVSGSHEVQEWKAGILSSIAGVVNAGS